MQLETIKQNARSEEIYDIIERMPTRYTAIVTMVLLTFASLLVGFGFIINYPDVVASQITINGQNSPVKLVANSNGKLQLLSLKPQQSVKEGTYLAVIQNSANTDDVITLNKQVKAFDCNALFMAGYEKLFNSNLNLGDLTLKYYTFKNSFRKLLNSQKHNIYDKQLQGLQKNLSELNSIYHQTVNLREIRKNTLDLSTKATNRDSILHQQKVMADAEYEHLKLGHLNMKENYKQITKEITAIQQQIGDIENKIQLLIMQKNEAETDLRIELISSYNEMVNNLSLWEQRFVLKATMDGRIEFTKFWTTNQFVNAGEEVFTIIPEANPILGQVKLPAGGAGKVKTGQEAIIKLDNYPYNEYGSIKGIVRSISLIANPVRAASEKEPQSVYLVLIDLPEGLKTNYGAMLDFKYEISGTAEIVTKKRRLIERLFDNLKYNVTK